MSNIIKWGILGCGKIAAKFASDLRLVRDARLLAVASRDQLRATEFAQTFGVPEVYTQYEDLAKADVDVIYIATPHSFHYEHSMLCLRHKKAVLCEKPFAINRKQAKAMFDYATAQGVFVMEAFWTKFLPQYKKLIELINDGTIGDIKFVQADFGFSVAEPVSPRLIDPLLGGGALLDIGLYPVFLAQSLLGKPASIAARIIPYPSGVDQQCSMSMSFSNGALASLSCTFAADTPVEAVIAGTKGRITMRNRFHNATAELFITIGKGSTEPVEVYREDGFGYQFEAQHVGECLQRGLLESPVMTHQDTLDLMETLDAIRRLCGVQYAADN